jgi:hypothetical protein
MSQSEETAHASQVNLPSFHVRLDNLSERLNAIQSSSEALELHRIMSEIAEAANELSRIDLRHTVSDLRQRAQRVNIDTSTVHSSRADIITELIDALWIRFADVGRDCQTPIVLTPRARRRLSNDKTCKERARDALRGAQIAFGKDVTKEEAYQWAKTQTRFGDMAPTLETFKKYLRN